VRDNTTNEPGDKPTFNGKASELAGQVIPEILAELGRFPADPSWLATSESQNVGFVANGLQTERLGGRVGDQGAFLSN